MAMLTCLHLGKWNRSDIRNDSAYVDAFGNTFTQFDGYVSIDVDSFNGVRSRGSYSQLGWVVHFLQNFLTRSIVIRTLLQIGTAQIIVDVLFAVLGYGLSVCHKGYVQKHVSAES